MGNFKIGKINLLFRKRTSTVMLLSKHQLSAGVNRKFLDLNEKIAILDYVKEHLCSNGYRKLHFPV